MIDRVLKSTVTCCMLAAALAAGLTGCGRHRAVLDEEEMVNFLIEAYQLEGFYAVESGYHQEKMSDEITARYTELFGRYGLTPVKFERCMDYYLQHPEQYEEIHRRVIDSLDARIACLDTPETADKPADPVEAKDSLKSETETKAMPWSDEGDAKIVLSSEDFL